MSPDRSLSLCCPIKHSALAQLQMQFAHLTGLIRFVM